MIRWAAMFIIDITYGIHGEEAKLYVPTATKALDGIAIAGIPGSFFVDQIPLCE